MTAAFLSSAPLLTFYSTPRPVCLRKWAAWARNALGGSVKASGDSLGGPRDGFWGPDFPALCLTGSMDTREETEKVLIQTCGARSCSFAENDEALQGLDLLPAVRRSKRWLAQRLEFGVFMYVIDQIWRIGLAELNIFFIKVDVQYYRSYRCTT